MSTRTRRNWHVDNQGQFSRQIGWKTSRGGKRVQHKFRLGANVKEAQRREQKLIELWEQVEKIVDGAPPLWDDTSLEIGTQLARGICPVVLEPRAIEPAEPYTRRVNRARAQFPMVPISPGRPELFEQGKELIESQQPQWHPVNFDDGTEDFLANIPTVKVRFDWSRAMSSRNSPQAVSMLHQAMRDYIAWIKQTYHSEHLGRITANGHNKIKQVGILLERHPDAPLTAIGYNEVEAMFLLWRKRPLKKGSLKPISRKSATNLMGELQRFFRWLHRSPAHSWRKPEDFNDIDMSVDTLSEDHGTLGRRVSVFTLDELVLLNQYATPLERVFLLLGLNCGFGIAEVASLQIGEAHLFQLNESQLRSQAPSSDASGESFIKRVRRKNKVYGEFVLFSQTVQAIQWQLERHARNRKIDLASPLLLNERGQPYDKPTTAGNANQQIPNRFRDLINRVNADDNQIRKLSFNKLRKTAGDLIRRFADGETAGIFLCHGKPVESDDLLDVYTNRPFDKVLAAIRKVELYLQPVFAAAGDEPFKQGPQAYTTRKQIQQIVDLRANGSTVKDIAEHTKKSKSTVHRQLKRAKAKGSEAAG